MPRMTGYEYQGIVNPSGDLYRRQYAAAEREKEIMKNVPGWRAGENVYHGQR